jgi:hypothetical protein
MKPLIKLEFGSALYGTKTPESDTDYKGVHVPDANSLVTQDADRVISNSTGSDKIKNTKDDVDDESYSILKFFDMLKRGDMVAQELLHVPVEKALVMSPEWKDLILPNKHKLVARDIKGFVGYIRTQSNRYGIRGSRVATARNAMDLFSFWVASYGANTKIKDVPMFHEELERFIVVNDHAAFVTLPVAKGSTETVEYFEAINRKVGYTIALKEAHAIYKRSFDEYGSRALMAEQNEGVDWKALYHAIRVSEQAMELLQTGVITFPRHNAAELLTIKRGEHPYKDIATMLENNLDKLENLMLVSDLPDAVDEDFMDDVVHDLHLNQIMDEYQLTWDLNV